MKNKLISAILGLLLVPGVLLAKDKQDSKAGDWNVVGHIPLKSFTIQSHRGAGELAPENTIQAFELGWKLGTVPESDLRTTKDGIIVAFHDENFKRVVKDASPELQKKGVVDLTFEELSKLDVGSWKGEGFAGRRVSKITEVFDLMKSKPKRRLYMDIKNVDLSQLAREVKSRKIGRQVILASPKPEIIREWKKLVPESNTLLWMGGTEENLRGRIEQLKKENFEGVTQLQIHYHANKDKKNPDPFYPSDKFMQEVGVELRKHDILFQSLPWGMTDPAVYHKLLDLGVASFATDHPEVTLKAVSDYYKKHK